MLVPVPTHSATLTYHDHYLLNHVFVIPHSLQVYVNPWTKTHILNLLHRQRQLPEQVSIYNYCIHEAMSYFLFDYDKMITNNNNQQLKMWIIKGEEVLLNVKIKEAE